MSYVEFDLFGVYLAPFAVWVVVAYAVYAPFRLLASRLGWLDRVWHPSLFLLAAYAVILSLLLLAAGTLRTHV